MIEINGRERRVLLALALMLTIGGGVRLVSVRRPAWTPGLGAAPDHERAGDGESGARFGTAADLDSLFLDGRMDINAAGEAHLRLLPGIGPALAKRVVETRRTRGPFRSVDELIEVKGIGPKTLERLRPLVVVRPKT